MIEILQRKCAGWEFETDALALEKIVQHQWTTLFPGGTSESKKVVAAYFMSELGIGGVRFYDMVVHDVRSAWPPQGGFRSYPYIFGLYGLTHIVLTGSGYYDRYLEPAGFETEIAAFRSALNEFTAVKKLTATEIDVISEILVCLKLLGVETGPEYSLMRQRIAGYQNPDGSWGSGKATDSATIHTTSVATLALMDFAPAFRSGNVFCDTSTYR
jgi:hypothetical protein